MDYQFAEMEYDDLRGENFAVEKQDDNDGSYAYYEMMSNLRPPY